LMLKGFERFILKELVKGGMTVQSLKYSEFERQAFPFPSLEEQQRIVVKIHHLMKICDLLESNLDKAHVCSERLMNAAVRDILQDGIQSSEFDVNVLT